MLAYIKGILEIKTKGYIVVEAGGLGYKMFMPESTIANTGNIGDKVQIYTFMRVREDDVSLYGFLTNEELRMFELLLSVSGIGAKAALGILSNITPSQFALAVISNDVTILKKVPGIGSKTAQRPPGLPRPARPGGAHSRPEFPPHRFPGAFLLWYLP